MSDHARCPSGVVLPRPALEVADIFRCHLDEYRQLHALSPGQQAVVHSGNVNGKLERARALLPSVATDPSDEASDDHDGDQLPLSPGSLAPDLAWPDLLLALTGQDVTLCPRCQKRTIQRQTLPPARAPPQTRIAA
jgi:hypothetical protein